MPNIKRSYLIIGAAALVVVVMLISIFAKFDSTQRTGVDYETRLSSQYKSNQNELSAFISGFYETLGIADRKSEAINTILTDAVKGRYEEGSSAEVGEGKLFSAITEAYPDLGQNMESYDKVIDYVTAGREAYKQDQDKLLDMLRAYDKWRESGLLDSKIVSMAGFPSDRLKASVGSTVYDGEDAITKMYDIVLAPDALEAYESGVMDPLLLPQG